MPKVDLLLLHPPSVYDFRRHAILYGPVSDLIPSSPVFEMYPLGFLTMANFLESRGIHVRIANLALRMINDKHFDVPKFLAGINPTLIGIDLHWLPHAHGAIEIAGLCKQVHPEVPVLLGGLSSTYFHQQIMEFPQVDFVLRGNATEPWLYQLMQCLQSKADLEAVPNLTWRQNGQTRVNPAQYPSPSLDETDIDPRGMVEMVLRHHDLASVLPFNGWWNNPITAVFTVKGCAHECLTCGSSAEACGTLHFRPKPAFRSPPNLVKNMLDISRITRGPIFLVGDLRQAGEDHAGEVLGLLRQANIQNEIVFEFFDLPSAEFLRQIDRSVKNWSIELSPESHDESIRRGQDVTTFFTNQQMEQAMEQALALRCHRVDVFFMIGLAGQTQDSVAQTIQYCGRLFELFDKRLSCFISPMGPFIDPASHGFENPGQHGYTLFARTLKEHRALLTQPTWQEILNYETEWMTREQLVDATYNAAEELNRLKMKYGRITGKKGKVVAGRIHQASALRERLEKWNHSTQNQLVIEQLRGEINRFSISTVCDKEELFWNNHLLNFHWIEIVRIALNFFTREWWPGTRTR